MGILLGAGKWGGAQGKLENVRLSKLRNKRLKDYGVEECYVTITDLH